MLWLSQKSLKFRFIYILSSDVTYFKIYFKANIIEKK